MDNRILFMILNDTVLYLSQSPMDHREWYHSLGYDPQAFEQVIRGYIMEGKIIYFRGMNFNYDQEVIQAARRFSPKIRRDVQCPSLEVYCGIVIPSPGAKWEPVVRIQEEELTGMIAEPVKKEKEVQPIETGPVLEFKNDIMDAVFVKRAILISGVVLALTIILKIILFSQGKILHLNNTMDVLLSICQIGLLGYSIFLYSKKNGNAKYTALGASIALLLTFHIWDIVLGVLYFLFTIDQNYFVKVLNFFKKIGKGKKEDKNS